MAYTANNACATLDGYLGVADRKDAAKRIIPGTKERGFLLTLPNEEQIVIFTYPIVHKQDDTKNYFDTRDSGPHERAVAWNYALQRHLKYFCLGVNDQVEKYVDYIFSLECNERDIEALSGTEDGDRSEIYSGNQIIIPNNYIPFKTFERITNNLGTFISVVHKDNLYDYLEKYDNRPYMLDKELIGLSAPRDEAELAIPDEKERIANGSNILLYGVPGSGKSWTIVHEYCKKGSIVERLVFHPDYTYSDFIGQILPAVDEDGQVSYEFTPGPFTNILKEAYWHPKQEYILIIEEINRGNAPAIFGEVFQLLDRKAEDKDILEEDGDYPIGTSEYGITNANMAQIVYRNSSAKVRIPSNLSIIGTMNTSDQNVFTLDTAFQRRWDMRLIENNFDNVDPKLADAPILDTAISWKNFCTEINKIVVGNNARMTSSEDKRLGAYFVHLGDLLYDDKMGDLSSGEYDGLRKREGNGTITETEKVRLEEIRDAMKQNRKFPEKVIKYLWDDAFKFNREVVFETTDYQSLEQVIRVFMYAKGIQRFAMFKENVRSAFADTEQ